MGYVRQSGREMRCQNVNGGVNNLSQSSNLNHGQINHLSYQPQLSGNIRPKGLECYGGSQTQTQNQTQYQNQINTLNANSNLSQSGLLTQPNSVY